MPHTIVPQRGPVPLSFVVGVAEDDTLENHFVSSPCVAGAGSPHQLILVHDGANVGAKLNSGLGQAKNEWVVCAHQDVWLPEGWDEQVVAELDKAAARFGRIRVAGVYGVGEVISRRDRAEPLGAERIGWVADRGRTLRDGPELPAAVATLDELLLIVRRDSGLRFDPELGFHLYGADLCLQASELGLAVVALEALCHHHSRHVGLGEGFYESAAVFARKWQHRLPVATPCVIIDQKNEVHILGNAGPRPQSIAYALPSQGSGTATSAGDVGVGRASQTDVYGRESRDAGAAKPANGRAVLQASDGTTIPGLTSIIVPCWNQVEFTRHCLQALKEHTRPRWELIVVDNGSTDQTPSYLAGVRDLAGVPVTLVANPTNRGFPAAINQGLALARGEYLVMLNNDVVVTDGWLEQLIGLINAKSGSTAEGAESAEGNTESEKSVGFVGQGKLAADHAFGETSATTRGIGLVGPMSNYAAPPQLVEGVPYGDLEAMHGFAKRWREEHVRRWFNVRKLSGFCLLMKRAVYDAIGGLDERFGIGFFDDDDLAERARLAGFELAVAHDLFVHHFGSRTFVGNGIDTERLLDENARRFADKWGLKKPNGERVSLRPWRAPTQEIGPEQRWNEEDLTQRRRDAKKEDRKRSKLNDGGQGWARADGPMSEPRRFSPNSASSFASSRLGVSSPNSIDGVGDLQAGERARVSLTMIVRNEEKNLPHCLESVRGVFDEIVIVDTGSEDRTVEIAREFGARVFEFAWIDDFAAARNEALAHATGDYAFWLDADDVIEAGQLGKLRALLDGLAAPAWVSGASAARSEPRTPMRRALAIAALGSPGASREGEPPCEPAFTRANELQARSQPRHHDPTPAAYVVRCACDPSPDGTGGDTVVDHIRLFPLRPDVRWTYRVHEQILPSLRKAKVTVRWTDLIVRHTGYVDKAVRARKLDRDTRILNRELECRPDDPFVLFNLGAIAVERREWPQALGYLERSLALSAPSDSIVRKLYALIARVHQMTGDTKAALRTCDQGIELDPEDAELWFRKGVVHRHRGESFEAEQSWRPILNFRRPEQFCSVDQGIYGHLTRRNLAVLAAERGDYAEAEQLWKEVLAECPGDREALAKLGRLGTKLTAVGAN